MWKMWKKRKEQQRQVVVKVMNQEQASMQDGQEQHARSRWTHDMTSFPSRLRGRKPAAA
jgi:hypothetical protein